MVQILDHSWCSSFDQNRDTMVRRSILSLSLICILNVYLHRAPIRRITEIILLVYLVVLKIKVCPSTLARIFHTKLTYLPLLP